MSWNLVMEPWTSSFLYYVLKQKKNLMFWTLKKKKKKNANRERGVALSCLWFLVHVISIRGGSGMF